jgi:2-iminobutanoate/2-iminopropanoate deaminase
MKKVILFASIILVVLIGCSQPPITREVISSPDAPKAIGPYSQAIRVGNMLYLSGQLGMNPEGGALAEGIEAQARQALENQKAVLTEAGFALEDVVQCQVFITNMDNYPTFNAIYQEYFKKDFPARAVVEVSRLPAGGLVEIMMVAVKTQ